MAEICGAQSCPIADKVNRLEDQLDEFQSQNSARHVEIFERINHLERASDVLEAHYNEIIQKLDNLTKKVDGLEQKPAKRWESIVSALIGALVSGLVVYLMMKVGLG